MSRFFGSFCLFAVALACASDAFSRTWTNDKGEQIEADLVRVSGGVAILNKGSEAIRAPIDQLSQADQDYLEAYKEIRKFRDWQIGGETKRGRYVEFRDGRVVVKIGSENVTLGLDELSDPDRKMVEQLESLATTEAPSRSNRAASNGPRPGVVRSWTNSQGKEIEAEFRRVEGDKVVLYFRDKEWKFPLTDLSPADQAYIASANQPAQPDFGAMAGGPSSAGFNNTMGDIRGRMNPGFGAGGRDFAAEAQARHEQMMAAHEQRIAEMRTSAPSVPSQPEFARPNIDHSASIPPPSRRESRVIDPRNRDFTNTAPPTPSIPEPSRFAPPPMPQMVEVWECGTCGKEITGGSYKAGDKCPHCGVRFDYVEDENGRVTSGSKSGSGRISGRGIAAVISLVVGFFAWVGRKMFGGGE